MIGPARSNQGTSARFPTPLPKITRTRQTLSMFPVAFISICFDVVRIREHANTMRFPTLRASMERKGLAKTSPSFVRVIRLAGRSPRHLAFLHRQMIDLRETDLSRYSTLEAHTSAVESFKSLFSTKKREGSFNMLASSITMILVSAYMLQYLSRLDLFLHRVLMRVCFCWCFAVCQSHT